MEPIETLEDNLEKIEEILQKPRTPSNDNDFGREALSYASEMFRLLTARPRTITREQFEYYHDKANEITERYGKWN